MSYTILRHLVLEQIDNGQPFDLVFLTADRRRGTGGEIREVKGWAKVKFDPAETRLPGQFSKKRELLKDPAHSTHKTINIFNPANDRDHIIKLHWRLMVFFNGKRIIA